MGRGYHVGAGAPHAEVVALEEAGAAARGATLYCTLEPCCHTGRTGPCVDRIVEAGVRRVVVGVEDPDPRVDGGGVRHLRARGVEVAVGVGRRRAARLNEAFFTVKRRRRPFVTLKAAVSLDGRIAAAPGRRTPLTGRSAQDHAHDTRALVDAIGIGSETVLVDDPQLTARGRPRRRPFVRVLFDTRMRTPAGRPRADDPGPWSGGGHDHRGRGGRLARAGGGVGGGGRRRRTVAGARSRPGGLAASRLRGQRPADRGRRGTSIGRRGRRGSSIGFGCICVP